MLLLFLLTSLKLAVACPWAMLQTVLHACCITPEITWFVVVIYFYCALILFFFFRPPSSKVAITHTNSMFVFFPLGFIGLAIILNSIGELWFVHACVWLMMKTRYPTTALHDFPCWLAKNLCAKNKKKIGKSIENEKYA